MKNRMNIRNKALLAASSVVLALGAGCKSGELSISADADLGVVDTDLDDTDVVDTDVVDTDVIDTDVADTDVPVNEAPVCTDAGDNWAACCDERNLWCTEQVAADEWGTCMFGEDFSGSETGCFPWGPPAPPRLGAYA